MRDRVVNFAFHGIGAPRKGEENVWLSLEFFREILDFIGTSSRVHLSFDDGNKTDIEVALPELEKRNLRATFFILAGRIDSQDYLSRDDVSRLIASGMYIGSHGMKHVAWRSLTERQMREEFRDAKPLLEEITGSPVNRVACPHGEYDRRTLAGLRDAGFDRIYTSDGGYARESSYLQPRNSVWVTEDIHRIRSLVELEPRYGERLKKTLSRLVKRYR
jgi:peptidoglycan/xylan/chitin deacetylase (PgdA/CDA1 family)